jgi:hypothetical protein
MIFCKYGWRASLYIRNSGLPLEPVYDPFEFLKGSVVLDPVSSSGNDGYVAWHVAKQWDETIKSRGIVESSLSLPVVGAERNTEDGADLRDHDVCAGDRTREAAAACAGTRLVQEIAFGVTGTPIFLLLAVPVRVALQIPLLGGGDRLGVRGGVGLAIGMLTTFASGSIAVAGVQQMRELPDRFW